MVSVIPDIWLWTWKLLWNECIDVIKTALDVWYRHIDTAVIYGNEKEIWIWIKDFGIKRNDLWITTKVWIDSFEYNKCKKSVENSLKDLQVDYLDLVLLHWPSKEMNYDHSQTFDALMELKDQWKIRNFGVSNFTVSMLKDAIKYTNWQIFTNQVEYHVNLDQSKIKSVCDEFDLVLEAYSPLAHGHVFKNSLLIDIANKYWKTVSQIALKWLLQQKKVVALPKASNRNRLIENISLDWWKLDEEDLTIIWSLPKNYRYCNIPNLNPDWDL